MEIRNRVLYTKGSEEFNATGASTFALMDERNNLAKTIEYLEMLAERGVGMFRSILAVAWGPLWHGEDGFCWPWGGKMWPIADQDRTVLNEALFDRVADVLEYCRQRGLIVYLDLLDNSLFETGIGAGWYLTPDMGWQIYLDRIASLYHLFSETLIVGLGNEPSKKAGSSVIPMQQWMADYLSGKGVNVVGAEVEGVLDPLRSHPAINICVYNTPRSDNPGVVQESWQTILDAYFTNPDKVILNKEPPRRLYHWADDETHVGWLRDIAYLTHLAGGLYVHHGLGDGEEDQMTCHPFWGCNANDWLQIPEAVDHVFKQFSYALVPTRHATRFYGPNLSIIAGVGDGDAWAGVHDKLWMVYCKTDLLTLDVPFDHQQLVIDAGSGIVLHGPTDYKTGRRDVTGTTGCIIRIRELGPPVVC